MSRHLSNDCFNEIKYVIDNNINKIIIDNINFINYNMIYNDYSVNDFNNNFIWGREYYFLLKNMNSIKIRFNHKLAKINYFKFNLNLKSLHYAKKIADEVQIGFKIECNILTYEEKINILNIIHNTIKNYYINYNPSIFLIKKEIENYESIKTIVRKSMFPIYKQIIDNDSTYFINKNDIIIKSQSEYGKS